MTEVMPRDDAQRELDELLAAEGPSDVAVTNVAELARLMTVNNDTIEREFGKIWDEVRRRRMPRERRTGAAARMNPDDIRVFYGVLAGAALLPVFTFAASFAFQREFGIYTPLAEGWWWVIPCILELPLIVLTPMILIFRRRHESAAALWATAIALTAAAAAINFVHAVVEMPADPGPAHWFGAAFVASWPPLTLILFKFFARLAVKPERPEPAATAVRKPTKKGTRR